MRKTSGNCRKCGGFFTGGWLSDGCCAVCYRQERANFDADKTNFADWRIKAANGLFQAHVEHGNKAVRSYLVRTGQISFTVEE